MAGYGMHTPIETPSPDHHKVMGGKYQDTTDLMTLVEPSRVSIISEEATAYLSDPSIMSMHNDNEMMTMTVQQ